ncbi:MAG: radical SAM protein [Ignavibacteria bacterium]|nr:radical SAM protein [Ignavibacteria bacterium]
MRFLLINPTAPYWRVQSGTSPRKSTQIFRFSMLSSLYVAAAAPPGFDTAIVDEEVEPIDFKDDADIVGISYMTFNAPRAYEIADRFRSRGKTVIVGGYHPTMMPEEAAGHADAVCIGEAESNLPQMIDDFLHRRLQKFYRNAPCDLRNLPVPDRRLIKGGMYAPVDTVQATRGCPNGCSFCSIAAFFDHKFRARPVDQVIDELAPLSRYLLFMDDNLTSDPEYAKELFGAMIPLRKRWFSQCSVKIAYDDELLRLAVASGCRGLFLGLESLSDKNLQKWNKIQSNVRDYEWAVRKLHAAGIGVIAGIVFGYDADSMETFPKTLDFLLRCNVDALQATILTPFPGTPLYREMLGQGRITDNDWAHYDFRHVVFEPKGMSHDELRNGHDWVLDRFYARPTVGKRIWNEWRYLDLPTILKVTIPLNLSYRSRLRTDGTIASPLR